MARPGTRARSVFINCPFDADYQPLFEVLVFTVLACGFVPRCAREEADSGDARIEKLLRLLLDSHYGIHDISRTEVDTAFGLPRFNMPFELGLDMGCTRAGGPRTARRQILVLDTERYRFQRTLSDIAGQDIRAHGGAPDTLLSVVRDWLRTTSRRDDLPGEGWIRAEYAAFAAGLPELCSAACVDRNALNYLDYVAYAGEWLRQARSRPRRAMPAVTAPA